MLAIRHSPYPHRPPITQPKSIIAERSLFLTNSWSLNKSRPRLCGFDGKITHPSQFRLKLPPRPSNDLFVLFSLNTVGAAVWVFIINRFRVITKFLLSKFDIVVVRNNTRMSGNDDSSKRSPNRSPDLPPQPVKRVKLEEPPPARTELTERFAFPLYQNARQWDLFLFP